VLPLVPELQHSYHSPQERDHGKSMIMSCHRSYADPVLSTKRALSAPSTPRIHDILTSSCDMSVGARSHDSAKHAVR